MPLGEKGMRERRRRVLGKQRRRRRRSEPSSVGDGEKGQKCD